MSTYARKPSWLIVFFLMTFCGCQKGTVNIAIVKYATHPALDELESGFVASIQEESRVNRALSNIHIEYYNANANPQRAKEMSEIATRSDVSLIVAIATPAAQAVMRTPSEIPLLYGAVADPKGAGLIPSRRATGIQNVSPEIITKAVEIIREFFPQASRIGTIYNPGEQNSVYVQRLLSKVCDSLRMELVQRIVTDPTQLTSTTEDLLPRVDLIYSANDNTVSAGVTSVVSVCNEMRKPFIIGDLSLLSKGPLMAVGLEYRSIGIQLALMAKKILMGKPVSEIDPQGPPPFKVWMNHSTLELLRLNFSERLRTKVDSVLTRNR